MIRFSTSAANFGTYALCIALQTNCGTIFAYEPDKRSHDRLRAHLLRDTNALTTRPFYEAEMARHVTYLARFHTITPGGPPADGVGWVHFSSSPVTVRPVRF